MKTTKTYSCLFALLVVACPAREAVAQDPEAAAQQQISQEEALQRLQELGFVRQNAIYGEDFIDQVAAGNVEVVRLYLAAGMSPDVRDVRDLEQRNALLVAAAHGQAEVVKVLLEAGADAGVKDKFGRTPLVLAVTYEQDAVVQVLLKRQ